MLLSFDMRTVRISPAQIVNVRKEVLVDCLEVLEIQITARGLFVGSCVADFRFEICELFGISKVEFVL